MKNKYLITGCSGFVARHFITLLENLNTPSLVLGIDMVEPLPSMQHLKQVKFTFEEINLLDKDAVEKILSQFKPDFILHLASYSSVSYSWENPVTSFVNNTNIFLNLVDHVRLLNFPCRILSVGSSEEYGNVTAEMLPLKEDLHARPVSPYAVARVSQEMLSKVYADSYGMDIVLTRSFNHIGPGQRDAFVIPSFAKKLIAAKHDAALKKRITVGNIDIIRDFVDVRDVVQAYYLLLHKGEKGEVYNICSGEGKSLKDVLDVMINLIGIDIDIEVDHNLIRPNDNQVIIGSYDKLHHATGWKPGISFIDSLSDIMEYWQKLKES